MASQLGNWDKRCRLSLIPLARYLDTGAPFSANSMAWSRTRARGMVPKRSNASSHPATQPGVSTARGPSVGTYGMPRWRKKSMVAACGAGPLALMATTRPSLAR